MEKNQKMNKQKRLLLNNNKRVLMSLLKKTPLFKLKLPKMEMKLKSIQVVLFKLMSTNNNRHQHSKTPIQLSRLKLIEMEMRPKNNQTLLILMSTKLTEHQLSRTPALLPLLLPLLLCKLKLIKKKILIHYLKSRNSNNLLNPHSRKKLIKQTVMLDLIIMTMLKIQISAKLKTI